MVSKVFLDQHIGKGLKKDPVRKKVDVDLTDYVDGRTTQLSPDGKIQAIGGNSGSVDICALMKALTKRDKRDGDRIVAIGTDGSCALIPVPSSENPFDFTCKLPYSVEAGSSVATKGGDIVLTYTFTNNYDNAVSFKFLLSDASAAPFTFKNVTKTSGSGSVRNLNAQQTNIEVTNLQAGQNIVFTVTVTPTTASRYNFAVHGLADVSGGNSSGLNTCGSGAGVMVLDGGA